MARARTRGEKLRRKRGRAVLPAAEREPNGKKSRRQASKQEQEHEMQAAAIATAKAQRVRMGVPESLALDPRLGYELGKLTVLGILGEHQHQAGKRFAEDMGRFYSLTGIGFPSARAQNLYAVHGHEGDIDTRAAAASSARSRMTELRAALLGKGPIDRGRRVYRATHAICVEDQRCMPADEPFLRWGLNVLVRFYGIPVDTESGSN